jgi:hypothetical protein
MTKYRYDRDMECMVEVRDQSNYFEEKPEFPTPFIIRDDIGAGVNGLRHMASGKYFDSKSNFRRHTKERGLEEIGNDLDFAWKRPEKTFAYYRRIVQSAFDQFRYNYNGTADVVKQMEAQSQWMRRHARRY